MAEHLDFILGRAGSGKTHECIRAIAEAVQGQAVGAPLLLVVPEHMTYTLERALAERLPGNGTMRAQVVGFRRLAYRLLTEAGESVLQPLTDLGKRVLLRALLRRRQPELQSYARAAEQRGFSATLAELFVELKSYAIAPEQLDSALNDLGEGALSHKLHDLALLYGDFDAATRGRFADSDDRMAQLAQLIPQSAYLRGADIWIDGFIFFTPVERNVIGALLRRVNRLHVTLPLDSATHPGSLFARPAQTLRQLSQLARDCHAQPRIRLLTAAHRYAGDSALAAIEAHGFDYCATSSAATAGVKLVEAATRRLELEAVAADIVRLCRDEHCRYRDIGIIVRDAEHYVRTLEFVLAEYGVPYFTDSKRAAVHHPLAELIRSALEVVDERFSYDAAFRCVKTGLFPLTPDDADLLENFVLARGLRGFKAWARTWTDNDLGADAVARINAARTLVVEPLATLNAAFDAARTVRDYCLALYNFLLALNVPQQLAQWATEAQAGDDFALANEHRRIWREVMATLDQLVAIAELDAAEAPVALDDFSALLNDALDALQLALIPPKLDAVTVALFDQNSLGNVRALYILGANDGVLPRRIPEHSLLTDADRLRLQQNASLTLAPSKAELAANESYMLYHAFTLPREYLCVSWSLSDSEGEGLGRSSVVNRIVALLPSLRVDYVPLEGMEGRDDLLYTNGNRAVARLAPAIREFLAGGHQERAAKWAAVYNWARQHALDRLTTIVRGAFNVNPERQLTAKLARRLYLVGRRQQRLRSSVSRAECFNACPFQHFARYGLQLRPRAQHEFTPADFGSLLHQVMQEVGASLQRSGVLWRELDEAARHELCARILAAQTPLVQNAVLMSSAQYQHLAQRIGKTAEASLDFLTGFARQNTFEPRYFETAFGSGTPEGEILVLPVDGETDVELNGKIDRIDTATLVNDQDETAEYYLVIDYKTGNTELTLDEVYFGLKLQLLTYVMAAQHILANHGETARPAGMLYCLLQNRSLPTKGKKTAEEVWKLLRNELRLNGWLLADVAVIASIDSSGQYLCAKLSSKGLNQRTANQVKTADQLDLLLRYAAHVLRQTARDIVGGNIAAHPYRFKDHNACEWCKFRSVCAFDVRLGNTWRKIATDNQRLQQMSAALDGDQEATLP